MTTGSPVKPASHDDDARLDDAVYAERDRLVAQLRDVAERLEAAPLDRLIEGLAWFASSAEPLFRAVDRALGRRPKPGADNV